MKIAAAAWPLDWFDNLAGYLGKIEHWILQAQQAGARLLVFPEYGAMELAALGGKECAQDLERALHEVARHGPAVATHFEVLARRLQLTILAPSAPVFIEGRTRPVNRAMLFGPEGLIGWQDKQIMTRFEREIWHVEAGPEGMKVFDTPAGKLGIVICYDSEFPLLARKLVENGAEILLVPSCTDSLAGFSRVRIGAMARALENQCIVVQSPTVGLCDFCPAVDENVGSAALYGPPDLGFPPTGVIAESPLNASGWTIADIDLQAVARVRAEGAVFNHQHWPLQQARITL